MKNIDMWFSMGSTYTFSNSNEVKAFNKTYNLKINFYPFNLKK